MFAGFGVLRVLGACALAGLEGRSFSGFNIGIIGISVLLMVYYNKDQKHVILCRSESRRSLSPHSNGVAL